MTQALQSCYFLFNYKHYEKNDRTGWLVTTLSEWKYNITYVWNKELQHQYQLSVHKQLFIC